MALQHVMAAIPRKMRTSSTKLALVMMAAEADEQGYLWGTMSDLAGMLPIERRHMIRIVHRLQDQGLLQQAGPHIPGRGRMWRVMLNV